MIGLVRLWEFIKIFEYVELTLTVVWNFGFVVEKENKKGKI